MTAPIIETPRLKLRPHRKDDFSAAVALWSDPIVTRFIGGKPSTAHEVWLRLLRYVGHWQWMGFGYWAIEDRSSGEFIGELGFADFKRDLSPSFGDFPELGWVFQSQVHGKGLASEATRAVTAWGDENLVGERTVCLIEPANLASLRVADKCGYREYQRILFHGTPMILLERVKTYRSSR